MTTEAIFRLYNHECNNCGASTGVVVVRGGDLLEDLPGTFQFIKCDNCGVLRQEPRMAWEDLSSYYQPGYVCHGPQLSKTNKTLDEKIRALGQNKRINLVSKHRPEGKWLDVGCGSGLILQAAKERGNWELFGVEPVLEMAEYTNTRLEIPIYTGTFENYPTQISEFDIITMWDVLEHLSEPFDAIKKVTKMLKPGGVFILTTPNLDSLDRQIFKETWLGYDLPRHLYLFPDSILRKVFNEQGLKVIDRFCFTGSHGTWHLDLSYWNKRRGSSLLNLLLTKDPSWLPFRLLTFLPLRLVDWLKLGTNVTYVVKKSGE